MGVRSTPFLAPAFPKASLGVFASLFLMTAAPGCGGDGAPDNYGSVRAKLNVLSAEDNPLPKTRLIKMTAIYNRCITNFYRGKGTSQQFSAPEGDEVLKEWAQRLCAAEDPSDQGGEGNSYFECDPKKVKITQDLSDETEAFLKIKIEVTKSQAKKLLGTHVRIGPLPLKDYIAGDCKPKVLLGQLSLVGLDGKGKPAWRIASFKGEVNPSPQSFRAFEATIEPEEG